MTHVLAIARREIEERAFVFVAAIAMALVSLVVLVIPHGTFAERKGVVVILGFLLGVAFTWALALILGSTLIGRELSEKRLSFYFTRPISGSAVWFGKLLAALVLLAVSFAIVHAIPLGIGYDEFRTMSTLTRARAVASELAVAVLLLLGAHVVSTWIRSRSPMLAADFIALLVVIVMFIVSIQPLVFLFALGPLENILAIELAALLVAVGAGGAWQLSRGRIDVRRSHRELSFFVWTVLFVAAIAVFAYSRWALGASPRDLRSVGGLQHGNIVELRGEARGYYPEFVVNPATGGFARSARLIAQSGGTVAVLQPAEMLTTVRAAYFYREVPPTDWTLTITQLSREAKTVATLPLSGRVVAIGTNDDGSRAAVIADDILTVYDTVSRHALASATAPQTANAAQLEFLSPSVVRAFLPNAANELYVRDFDVRTRRWSAVAGPMKMRNSFFYRVAGSQLFTSDGTKIEVRDLRNPTAAAQAFPLEKDSGDFFMRDGRHAVYHHGKPSYVEIRKDGVQQHLLRFPPEIDAVRVSAELADGRLLVTTYSQPFREKFDTTTYILDPNSGTLTSPMPHVSLPGSWPSMFNTADPEVTHRVLLHRDTSKVDVIDLRTGVVRPLFE